LIKEEDMSSKPMEINLLSELRTGILKALQEISGRRPQILTLADIVNLREGKAVI
jgi:hypothetical protein